jgi:signal transduction histidine kinase
MTEAASSERPRSVSADSDATMAILRAARAFASVGPDDFDEVVEETLRDLSSFIPSDRIAAYRCDPDRGPRLRYSYPRGERTTPTSHRSVLVPIRVIGPTVWLLVLEGPGTLEPWSDVHRHLLAIYGALLEGAHQRIDVHERAESLIQLQRELVSNVSHEIRTPLHAINGFTLLLETTDLDESQRGFVGRVRRASAHLLEMVDDLLTLGRARVDASMVELGMVVVGDVVTEAVELVEPPARELGLSIHVELPEDVVVYADPLRLRQVLVNLLSNAIKFSPPESVVRLVATTDETFARLAVIDRGRGVAPDRQHLLFTPFSRVSGRDIPGTGLGLVVARALSERMQGTLEYADTPGGGATFTLTLARTEAAVADA